MSSLARRVVAEALGTALLLATVVGSGIMGDHLSGGNVGLALLVNTIATAATLVVIITAFGPVSGAHFNPVVTGVEVAARRLPARDGAAFVAAQVAGAALGVVLANVMFGEPAVKWSTHERAGFPLLLGEFVATFGLLGVIVAVSRRAPERVPAMVAAWITAGYWFTSSSSFANPAVTLARTLTDTFGGIRPADVAGFVVAQVLGAVAGYAVFDWLVPVRRD
ncbi:MAG: MIP/aquaporin family protein [Myxococcaceae bacterium]